MHSYGESQRRYITVSDLIRTLWIYKRRVILVAMCTFALVCAVFAFMPRRFQSEAKLLLRLGRESVSLDATASFGPMVAMQQTRQTEVNTTKEVLSSRALCEQVVDDVGVERILAGGETGDIQPNSNILGPVKTWIKWVLNIPQVSQREAAVTSVQNSIAINSEELSNIVTVSAVADSPEFAQEIVQSFCNHFIAQHVRLYHAASSVEFFEEQTQRLAESLEQAREHLRDKKNRFAIGSIEGRRNVLELQIGNLQGLMHANAIDITRARSKATKIRKQIEEQAPTVVAEIRSGVANPATDGMRQQFYALELEERALKQKFQADHPRRQAISQQLEEARQIFDTQAKERTEELTKINEEYQSLSLQLHHAEADLAGSESARDQLQLQLAVLNREMAELNVHEAELAETQMQLDENERNYRIHSERLEQARVDQELAVHQITNIRIAQEPTLQERPVSPKVSLTFGLGLVFACLAGLTAGMSGLFLKAELLPVERDDDAWDDIEEQSIRVQKGATGLRSRLRNHRTNESRDHDDLY